MDTKTLVKIAFSIKEESQMQALGLALSFSQQDVAKYLTGNPINTRMGDAGTKKLLLEWRDTVPPGEQDAILRFALHHSGLDGLKDECLESQEDSSG